MIELSGGFDLYGSVKFFIQQSSRDLLSDITWSSSLFEDMFAIHRPILPLKFLDDIDRTIYLSQWSNITVHYAALW